MTLAATCLLYSGNAVGAEPDAQNERAALAGSDVTSDPVAEPPSEHRLHWTYPRFRFWQYVASGVVSGTNLWMEFVHRNYPERTWTSGILFDDGAKNVFRARTQTGRDRADALSDWFWHPTQYYPIVVDSLLVPLALDDWNWDVAVQMTLIDWQAIGLAFFVTRGLQLFVGRDRPSLDGCSNNPDAKFRCTERGPAFPSGHTAMAATGAGLACAHHQGLPLYGGGWVEMVPCAVLSTTSAINGLLRMVADKHRASDVLFGYAAGLGIGYGVPYLLHYQFGKSPAEERNIIGLWHGKWFPAQTAIAPMIAKEAWGLSIIGWQ